MKLIMMLGLAASAALMAMALVGTSSAMAGNTRVCGTHEEPCGNAWASQTFHLKSGEVGLLHGLGIEGEEAKEINVLCLSVLSEVDYGKLASPQDIEVLTLEFGGCGFEGFSGHSRCTITVLNLPWLADLLKTELNLGEFAVLSGTGGEPLIFKECTVLGFIKIKCEYKATGTKYHVDGATATSNGLLLAEGTVPLVSGGELCPEESEITSGSLEPLTKGYIVG